MLQDAEERRRAFTAMLLEGEAEADRDGTVSVEEVLAELDQLIAAAEAND